jgi:hypothetical protein
MHGTTAPFGAEPEMFLTGQDHSGVPKLLYSREDAAFALSLSIRSLDYLIAAEELRVRRVGKRVLIPANEVMRFAQADHACLTQHGPRLLVA